MLKRNNTVRSLISPRASQLYEGPVGLRGLGSGLGGPVSTTGVVLDGLDVPFAATATAAYRGGVQSETGEVKAPLSTTHLQIPGHAKKRSLSLDTTQPRRQGGQGSGSSGEGKSPKGAEAKTPLVLSAGNNAAALNSLPPLETKSAGTGTGITNPGNLTVDLGLASPTNANNNNNGSSSSSGATGTGSGTTPNASNASNANQGQVSNSAATQPSPNPAAAALAAGLTAPPTTGTTPRGNASCLVMPVTTVRRRSTVS